MGERFFFPAVERLKSRDEIREVFKKGKVFSCPGAKLFVKRNDLGHNRIAFTFSRKFGNAVRRNRARRVSREAYRLMRGGLKTGFDMALLVYPDETLTLSLRTEQLSRLFKRGMLFAPERYNQ